ncbi:vWA domain-containing protein [Deinococcus yavapaiensis]|uniref:Ca-activated chloride channel family protein n=1 Tax=Deinococcus yavapaiensis KR-236 TaxID=694435 RepID=A0A318S759_9DEIO|nr:VWA domain-containing protein [Deinococcus yavapaiensis]PYE51020.1 Ca-activated chloride channel family protein [Deinococcus yavapaiensis KR-236]
MTQPRVEFLPLTSALKHGEAHDLTLLVRVHPSPAPSVDGERPPLNLALVLDRSGSMSGRPLEMAKEAAIAAIRQCQATDRVSVVAFGSQVDVVVPSQPVLDAERLAGIVRSLGTGGMTALHAGWLEGATQVATHLRASALNRVILLSDGQANVGLTDRTEIAAHVKGLTAKGVSTTTMGFGPHYDENLLLSMADAGDGNFEHVEDPTRLPTFFEEELQGLTRTTGRTVSLGLEPNPEYGVTVTDVLNVLPRNEFDRLMLPNLIDGRSIDVLVTLHVPHAATRLLGRVGVTRVRLAWTDTHGVRHAMRAQLDLDVVTPEQFEDVTQSPEVLQARAVLQASRAKRDAIDAMDRGDRVGVQGSLRQARDFLASAPMPSPALLAEQRDVEELKTTYDSGEEAVARKRALSQSHNSARSKPRR